MEDSIFIVQLLALIFVTVGLGMLISPDYYRSGFEKMTKNMGVLYLGGLLALVGGFTIVVYYNVWRGWEALVTVIGWVAFIKGLLLLITPKFIIDISLKVLDKKNFTAYGTIALLMGMVFSYFGFFGS